MVTAVAAAAAAAVAPMKDFPPIGRIPRHRLSLLRSSRVGTSPLPPTCHRCPGFPSLKLNSYRHWHRRQSHRISLGWSQSYQPRRWHLLLPLVFPWQLSLPGIRDEEVVAEGEEAWEIVVEPVVFAAAAAAAVALGEEEGNPLEEVSQRLFRSIVAAREGGEVVVDHCLDIVVVAVAAAVVPADRLLFVCCDLH